MGGFDSMITEKTRNVLIEAAWFDPATIRKTAKRHGLHTDASHRFERGADFGATPLACARVAQLILSSAGGKLDELEVDAVGREIVRPELLLRYREVERILGKSIEEADIQRILDRLGFAVAQRPATVAAGEGADCAAGDAACQVRPPSWRLDVEREIDLIEEIARIHGYENFANTLPKFTGAVIELPDEKKDARLRRTLLALGYHEAISLTFSSREEAKLFSPEPALALENPVSEEATVLRTSLLPGMLQMLSWNLNRGNNDVRLFEAGRVFARIAERADERKRISLGATGSAEAASWGRQARPYTFFDMKGDLEELLQAFSHRSLYFDQFATDFFHPGRAARAVMDGATIAQFGQLHPDLAAARKLRQDVYIGEIYLERLYAHGLRQSRYTPILRFPAVSRDFSFLFDNAVTFERIQSAVGALHLPALRQFVPVEIFRGGAIPAGKYSLLLRAEFQSPERTLTDEEVTVWTRDIVAALSALGGTLRSS